MGCARVLEMSFEHHLQPGRQSQAQLSVGDCAQSELPRNQTENCQKQQTLTVGFLPAFHWILVPSAFSNTLSSSSDMWYVFVCRVKGVHSQGAQTGDTTQPIRRL